MREVTRYSPSFKENLLAKLLTPNGPSVIELSKEFNIPYSTIHTWVSSMKKDKPIISAARPKDRSAEFKLQAVIETMTMTDEERGAYCRKHGIYTHNLDEWKKIILSGLNNTSSKEQKVKDHKTIEEMNKLKKDLQRKDKALAEVSALLILKKKADLLWGDKEDD